MIIKTWQWLTGTNDTGLKNTDRLTDDYRDILSGLQVPKTFTTAHVSKAAQQSGIAVAQRDLARKFHSYRKETIQSLAELDKLNTDTAVLYSETSAKLSDQRAQAQQKILTNQATSQFNSDRVNALRLAFAEGLKL